MSKHTNTTVALAVGAALAGLSMAGNAFAMQPLAQGYALGATMSDHGGEKAGEGKCGEGSCGMAKMDSDKDGRISSAEFAAAHDGDASKFAAHDPDGDGFISAAEIEAHHAAKAASEGKCGEGKCGEGKCGASGETPAADKAAMEGKCGEGKCGAATGTPAAEAATEGDDEAL